MSGNEDFHDRYAAALRNYLDSPDDANLSIGNELGRTALQNQISLLEIVENHVRLVFEIAKDVRIDGPIALEFLLQLLAPLDVAMRGFIDGNRRYAEQRDRADWLADRDKFRNALVNSLQEGFFVADHEGSVIEMNSAFIDIIGFPSEGLPYRWPHPWLVDTKTAAEQIGLVLNHGRADYETPIRHGDGHLAW